MEALQFYESHKSLVRGIIFISPYWVGFGGIPSILRSMASANVGRALLLSMTKSEVTDLLPRRAWGTRVIPNSLLAAYRHCVDVPGWEEDILQVLARTTASHRPKNVDVPVLLLHGDSDHLTEAPAEYAEFISEFSHSRTTVLADCGAAPQEELPELVCAAITAFVTEILEKK